MAANGTLSPGTSPSVAYPPGGDADREALLSFIRKTPIAFGAWRDLKALYKAVEADPGADPRLIGALLARLDTAPVSTPKANPLVDFGNVSSAFLIRNHRAYVIGRGRNYVEEFRRYDLQTPDRLMPRLDGRVTVADAGQMTLCGNFACLSGNPYHTGFPLRIVDISDPAGVRERSRIDVGMCLGIASTFPYIFVAQASVRTKSFDGLRIVTIAHPDQPRIIGEIAIKNMVGVAAADDSPFVFVTTGSVGFSWNSLPKPAGIRVISVENPAKPRLVGALDLGSITIICGAASKKSAFIGTMDGVQIVDLTDPEKPRKGAFWSSPNASSIRCITVEGDMLYAGSDSGRISLIDVRNPAHPETLSEVNGSYLRQIQTDGDLLYVSPRWGGHVAVWHVANPRKPVRVGMPPSAVTMKYMKRRARRYLHDLAHTDPARYVDVVYRVLLEASKMQRDLDPVRQWVTLDILFGCSARYVQTQHGRGRYVAQASQLHRLYRRRAVARFSAAWDTRPDLALDLLKRPGVFWQAHEMALGVLLRTGTPLPALTETVLAQLLASPSPALQAVGTRQTALALQKGKRLKPEAAARAFLLSCVNRRAGMRPAIVKLAEDHEWASETAACLLSMLPQHTKGEHFTRRGIAGATLVAEVFATFVESRPVAFLLLPLLRSGQKILASLVTAGARQAKPSEMLYWLNDMNGLEEDAQELVLEGLEEAARDCAFDSILATQLVVTGQNPVLCAAGWRLLAASKTENSLLAALWTTLLEQTFETPSLRAAMNSPHALTILTQAGITPEQIAERLTTRPFLVALLSPETFTRITQRVPAGVTLQLIAAAPDDLWVRLREGWLRNLREGVGLTDLWLSLPAALGYDLEDRIAARILGDKEIAATFHDIEESAAETLLALREPLLDTPLAQWASSHETLFPADSELLRQAATHILPQVRAWALARVEAVGMRLPFALRLLESEVPPSVAVGKRFFAQVPSSGDTRELTNALALCDSPVPSVRAFGREYVRDRRFTLPRTDLYRALFEHSDSDMQAFVATLLEAEPQNTMPTTEATQFDREVLQTRDRARRAKEAVKSRQSTTPTLDVETLLALARDSGTPRDAEWALSQLARRALAGEKIDGFAVEGAAGG